MEKKIGFKAAVVIALGWRFGNLLADLSGELIGRSLERLMKYLDDDPDKAIEKIKEYFGIEKEEPSKIKMGFM